MRRKLLVLFFGFVLLISCKQVSDNCELETPTLKGETEEINLTDEQKRELYLYSLINVQSTLVEDEKVEKDLLNILKELKEKEETSKIAPTLQKIDDDLFGLGGLSFFSTDGEEIEENIKLSLYKLESGEKSGFAITCNDLRVGEILALVEEGEFNEDNPFIELVSSNIKTYVNETLKDWYRLKKKKEGECKHRSVWEGLVSSGKYSYENWKVNNKSSPSFLLKTKWDQSPIYNDVIIKLKGGDFPAGCVGVAIAQIMAFHEYPQFYYGTTWEDFNTFKAKMEKHFPIVKKWDGKYDWWILKWPERASGIDERFPIYRLQLASLMYEIAESSYASYSTDGTGMGTENYMTGLLFHDYITGVCTKTPMPVDPDHWKKIPVTMLPPWIIIDKQPIIKPFSNIHSIVEDSSKIKSIGSSGNRIKYIDYSFDSIKSSIDNLCPVLIEGWSVNKKETRCTLSAGKGFKKSGHAWVIDGYCNLTCDAVHKDTKERKTITADYVHCNTGWDGWYNGYYISGVFTFGIDEKATAEDEEILGLWSGSIRHYKYNIKIFPNLIPKTKLGIYSKYPWYYNWRALW